MEDGGFLGGGVGVEAAIGGVVRGAEVLDVFEGEDWRRIVNRNKGFFAGSKH